MVNSCEGIDRRLPPNTGKEALPTADSTREVESKQTAPTHFRVAKYGLQALSSARAGFHPL
jgi:hypothetical protein